MKQLILVICVLVFSQLKAQNTRLLVRGDDMGFSHSGNLALIKSYKEGVVQSIEVLVPSPWFPEAVKLLKENPGVDVGIHLTLTSEWENVKWRPLTEAKSLKDANGYFFPMLSPNSNYPGQSVSENKWTIEDIEKEFRAQIELAIKNIPRISHISGHMGCARMNDEVKAMVKRLTAAYHIGTDVDQREEKPVSTGWKGPHKTAAEKLKAFLEMIDSMQPNTTYFFLEHPGLDNEELRAIFHTGYENVAEDRQGVTDLFINPLVKEALRKKGVKLISYKELGG